MKQLKKYFTPKVITILILSFLFTASVVIRIPYLKNPLGGGYCSISGSTLHRLKLWHNSSVAEHKFLLRSTGNKQADKNLTWEYYNRGLKDKKGNHYYTSYPPFAFIAPHLVFSLLDITPGIIPLRAFNLLIHFLCCLLIFLIISLITRNNYKNKLNIPAIMGYCVYLFAMLPWWFHGIDYHSETFVQIFFILTIYLFLKILDSPQKTLLFPLFGTSLFLTCYSEWIGLVLAFFIALYALFCIKQTRMFLLFVLTCIIPLSALVLFIFHYGQITNCYDFVKALIQTYFHRSGLQGKFSLFSTQNWKNLLKGYFFHFKGFLILIYTGLCVILFTKQTSFFSRSFLQKNRLKIAALFIALAPVLVHHVALFNFTIQNSFALLKTTVFFAILIALIYDYFAIHLKNHIFLQQRALNYLLCLFIVANLYSIRKNLSYPVLRSTPSQIIGTKIKEIAQEDEVIFVKHSATGKHFAIDPPLCLYAQRGIAYWRGQAEAEKLIQTNNLTKGILFVLDEGNDDIQKIKHISL